MKKALVTGATGFVGSNLVAKLMKEGWNVDVIVRPSSDLKLLEGLSEALKVYKYDGDIDILIDIMNQSKPDVVFHVASLFLSEHKVGQVDDLIHSNILFGTQLLEAMAQSGVKNIVNTSTFWEHYEGKDYSPVNLYAATKRAFHDLLQFYVEARGIRAITLKLFDTYGPNDPRPKLFKLLMKVAETGETLAMSPGEQKIDLVHIDDVVAAYLIAAQRLIDENVKNHEQYAICTGNPLSIRAFVALVEQKIGKKINIQWGGRPYRKREAMTVWTHGDKLPEWESKISLEKGLIAISWNDTHVTKY